jgi:hypothetical protein
MTDTLHVLHAALEMLRKDVEYYSSNASNSDYSRAYDKGAKQEAERAIRYIEHALSVSAST